MTEANVSFAGSLTDDPELRHTKGGITRAVFRVAVSGRREQEASFFPVIVAEELGAKPALGDRHAGQDHQERRRLATRGGRSPIR